VKARWNDVAGNGDVQAGMRDERRQKTQTQVARLRSRQPIAAPPQAHRRGRHETHQRQHFDRHQQTQHQAKEPGAQLRPRVELGR
jgi:hypothetical protein